MKLVLDQGLPRSAVELLTRAGHEVVHVGDIGMSRATDAEILAFARERGGVVVTLDADFHGLLARDGAIAPSVIRLRVQGMGAAAVCELVLSVIDSCAEPLAGGAAVTANEERARVRLLPIR